MDSQPELEVFRHRIEYINNRWKQLQSLEKEAAEVAVKYLLLTNSGGAVTVLSFMGASDAVRSSKSAVLALILFALGVIAVGVFNAWKYHRVSSLFRSWQHESARYPGKISWETLLQDDERRSATSVWPFILAYASFLSFISGAIAGLISLIK